MPLSDDERRELLPLIEATIDEPPPGRARLQLEGQKSLLPDRETADALPTSTTAAGMLLPMMAPVAATALLVELVQRRRLRQRYRRSLRELQRLVAELMPTPASELVGDPGGSPYRQHGDTGRAGASPEATRLGDSERVALVRHTRKSLHPFRAKRPLHGLAIAERRLDTAWQVVAHVHGYDVDDALARLQPSLAEALGALSAELIVERWIFREGEPSSLIAEHAQSG